MDGTDKTFQGKSILARFTKKEISHLIDATECLEEMDSERRNDFNLPDEVLKRLRFKLWRLLDVDHIAGEE